MELYKNHGFRDFRVSAIFYSLYWYFLHSLSQEIFSPQPTSLLTTKLCGVA